MTLDQLEVILTRMLSNNTNITARSLIRETDCELKHASDVTRQSKRRLLLEQYQMRQQELRAMVEKTNSQSRTNLSRRLALLQQENEKLKSERNLLIASHKAMLLAVGEMGGIAAWRRFYPKWEEVREQLLELQALPSAMLLPVPISQ